MKLNSRKKIFLNIPRTYTMFAPEMAWLVLFLLYGDARSRNFLVPGSIYPTTLCRKIIWILRLCFCRRQESNPGRQCNKRPRYPLHHCTSAGISIILSKVFPVQWKPAVHTWYFIASDVLGILGEPRDLFKVSKFLIALPTRNYYRLWAIG